MVERALRLGVRRTRRKGSLRVARILLKIVLAGAVLATLWSAWIGASLLFLPSVLPLRKPGRSFVITVKDWHGKDHPFVVGPRNRDWTPIGAIPPSLKKAVIAAEDARFLAHDGVDYEAIREAIKTDIREGRFVRGGSTITQQLAKNLYLSREKTLSRKIKEYVLARRLDDTLSKSRILELYLNVAELGPMVYGVGRASRFYFGKPASGLNVRESAFLAAMLPGPKVYNPYRNLDRVVGRSDRILRRMFSAGMIPEEEYRSALSEEPNITGLQRKVEKTMESSPPEEPLAVPDGGPGEGEDDSPPIPPVPTETTLQDGPGRPAPEAGEAMSDPYAPEPSPPDSGGTPGPPAGTAPD